MRYKLLSLFLIFALIFSLGQTAFAVAVSIPDSNLNSALHQLAGVPAGDSLTTEKLAAITGAVNLSNKGISNIDGVQYLTGASSIDISLNSITSVPREIENLTALESLDLSGNRLSRIPSNIGVMSGLKNLDISANRLDEIPSALTKLSLTTFKCDYNFLDVSDGSSARSTINLISAQNKYFEDQLIAVQKLSAYSPQNGTIVIYWDAMESIKFDSGAIGEIDRFVVLDSGYKYIGESAAYEKSYSISGLDTTTEYTFHVSADYYVKGTKYSSIYTKFYKEITLKAVPQNTPTMELSPTETPTVTPAPETPTPMPETPTPTIQADTQTPIVTALPSQAPQSTNSAAKIIRIIIIILAVIFVLVTLLIIMRAVAQRKHRNSRYRR